MLEQTTRRIEVFRAVLDCDALTACDDRAEFAEWATWTPSHERAEQDAREWTDDDAERPYVQGGWVRAGDLECRMGSIRGS